MLPFRLRSARPLAVLLAGGLLMLLAAAGAPSAGAAPKLPKRGTAVVESVDGPSQLTLAIGSRKLPVRLVFIDAPNAGECGAAEATTALKGFVRRAPKRLRYGMAVRVRGGGYVRDDTGRYWVTLRYRAGKSRKKRDLSSDLITTDWAHWGMPRTLDSQLIGGFRYADGGTPVGDLLTRPNPHPARGLWVRCGGRAHAPVSAVATGAPTAPVWNVTEDGITTSIGPLTLPTGNAPSITFGALSAITPVELVSNFVHCFAYLPALHLVALSRLQTRTCRNVPVQSYASEGPLAVATSRGPKVGDPLTALDATFPFSGPLPKKTHISLSVAASEDRWRTAVLKDPGGGDTIFNFQTFGSSTFENQAQTLAWR